MKIRRSPACLAAVQRARGFTFVELIISLVIIGVAVTGVLLVYTTTVARSADPLVRAQALAIAEAYLDEVVSKHYDDPDGGETLGAEGSETRATYDDVWDYDGLTGAPTRPDGSNAGLTDLAAYTVNVQVTSGAGTLGVTSARVDVSVAFGGAIIVSLWSYRAEYSP